MNIDMPSNTWRRVSKKPVVIITLGSVNPELRHGPSKVFCDKIKADEQYNLCWLKPEYQTAMSLIRNALADRCKLIEIAEPLKWPELDKFLALANRSGIRVVVAFQGEAKMISSGGWITVRNNLLSNNGGN